jgi:hypothetical protein
MGQRLLVRAVVESSLATAQQVFSALLAQPVGSAMPDLVCDLHKQGTVGPLNPSPVSVRIDLAGR